jgi:hypothetical protein
MGVNLRRVVAFSQLMAAFVKSNNKRNVRVWNFASFSLAAKIGLDWCNSRHSSALALNGSVAIDPQPTLYISIR